MNYAFDCTLGIPWLAQYQPQIDWLARSVKRRQDFDVSVVFTHLLVASRDWPHVTVVDGSSTTHVQRLPHVHEAVEQRLPHVHEAVEQWLPHDNVAVGTVPPPRVIGAVANELSRLEEGASSSSESDTSASSRGSRHTKTSHRSRRRLKPRRDASPSPVPTESVSTIEYVDGVPSHTRVIEVASPPRDAKSITSLPGLSWKNFLRDLKAGDIEQVFQVMRENKLYANLKKCVFCAPEIPVLGCYVSKNGVRADPEKVSSICSWPTPTNPTELRQWLGLVNYLHKDTKDYAGLIQPLSSLLKKAGTWSWRPEHQTAFDSVKKSLASAPILMLPDDSKPLHVVCDASDFAIGCALMEFDDEGHERVVSY
ncbi:unnamed protein product [Phytophthora fragariaefolia]|uniref:Unnamed protein product n=1 Tax=Phytophthora fragariaefolia TaxID=1490495 RepID=A0A9W6YDI7_9STRA|nr:unnamed protein product [Phytophthora fragariaefolia]